MIGKLILEDGSVFEGQSFGAEIPRAGEAVFSTGMVGYTEGLTDPSYQGQILILTYPLIGNYGVPDSTFWESDSIKVSGLIVSNYIDTPSHFQSKRTLAQWLRDESIPALEIKDTRFLTQKLRDEGAKLGKIVFNKDIPFYDPNKENLVAKVCVKEPTLLLSETTDPKKSKTVIYIDCGGKRNMLRCLTHRGVNGLMVPWDFDPFTDGKRLNEILKEGVGVKPNHLEGGRMDSFQVKKFDGIVVSNGPGDPKYADITIKTTKKALDAKIPLLGICLGHQLLSLAAGGDTKKLKFGHRSQNQPCLMAGSNRCFITTQNHGFAVDEIPSGFKTWFQNANDGSNEGIIHTKLPFMSVQFHPEATPGPQDTEWIFDFFLEKLR
ncbi:MAG: glutamine-hydrolyzing carbamoyl-phosphate synthase small subunit [Candidatus Levybacteria bacterium]|nr:glutamine-hydrolyzing carbamoyl-phosphate synthase small subunit [Candidatus Levybacteria bacterium]